MNFLKFLPLVLKFKDISEAYQSATGKDRPAYLSRRFVGALLVLLGAIASIALGVQIDENVVMSVTNGLDTLIAGGITLYGAILAIIGQIKAKK